MNPSPQASAPVIHTPAQQPSAAPQPADIVFQLYDKGVLSKHQVAKATLALKIPVRTLCEAFGYGENPKAFVQEFVHSADTRQQPAQDDPSWTPWTLEDAKRLANMRFGLGYKVRAIATELNRSYKSVSGFTLRTFKHGNTVDKPVWDLLEEGYSHEQIADAGYNSWRAEFTEMLYALRQHCLKNGYPVPVIHFEE